MCTPIVKLGIRCAYGHALINKNAAEYKVYLGRDRDISTAQLSTLPCRLLVLWLEYIFGLNGRKPARLFTIAERNRKKIKQKYYRRNVLWKCMARLVQSGHTPEQAADELYKIYVNKSPVTKMSDLIAKERKGDVMEAITLIWDCDCDCDCDSDCVLLLYFVNIIVIETLC